MLKQFNNIQLALIRGLPEASIIILASCLKYIHRSRDFPGRGGRYDSLLDKFNGSRPATGFALTEDVILTVLEKDMEDTYEPYYLYYNPAEYIEAFLRRKI